jgi:hypothetical protein
LAEPSLGRLGANRELIDLDVLGFNCGLNYGRATFSLSGALFGVADLGLEGVDPLFISRRPPGLDPVSDQENNYQRGDHDQRPPDQPGAVAADVIGDSG